MPLDLSQLANQSIVFIIAILVSSILLPLLVPLYKRFDLVDRPNARSAHSRAVPRGVGLVVFSAFVLVFFAFGYFTGNLGYVLSGALGTFLVASAALVAIGFIDDVFRVPALVKLVVQIGVAVLVIRAGVVTPLPELFGADAQIWVERVFTLFWIVGVINAVNFIDGSDGLCTSLCSLCMLVFVAISSLLYIENPAQTGTLTHTVHFLGLAAAGSALPFLLYNMAPAKCFLGDAGSMFFGFVLAVLGALVTQFARPPGVPSELVSEVASYRFAVLPWIVLVVPIADSVRVFSWRILRRRSPLRPDNTHLHHLLLRAGLTANQMVFFVGLLTVLFSFFAVFIAQSRASAYLFVGIGCLVVFAQIWFVRTSYRVRRFVTILMSKKLLTGSDVPQGYENAPAFRERLEQELARARRRKQPLSVAVVMVSGKQLDEPGASPLENPRFLVDLLNCLRREDVKARFTADRLAFLLVETERTVAEAVMQRIHEKFASIQRGESSDLRFGLGFASFPGDGDTSQALFNVADAHAKEELESQRASDDVSVAARPMSSRAPAGASLTENASGAPQDSVAANSSEGVDANDVQHSSPSDATRAPDEGTPPEASAKLTAPLSGTVSSDRRATAAAECPDS